jgi:EF hand
MEERKMNWKISSWVAVGALLAALAVSVAAQEAKSQNSSPSLGGTPTQSAAAPHKHNGKKVDYSPFFAAVDKKHDGKLTRDEWDAAGLKDKQFTELTKYKKSDEQYVTQAQLDDMDAPDALDANHDGKITLEEFINFTKNIAFECPGPGCAPDPSSPLLEDQNPAHDRK